MNGLDGGEKKGEREKATDTMVAGSHESIIPQIAADICLDHFAADSIARDKVFILTACHSGSRGSQCPEKGGDSSRE